MLRRAALLIAYAFGTLALAPLLLWSRLPLPMYSSFTAPSQLLALIPGYVGVLLRRVWYRLNLRHCGCNLTVDWMAVIRTRDTGIGDCCTLGVANWIGWVELGNNVMTGSHVVLTSGSRQHDFSDFSRPMRAQHGIKRQVVIGNDVWIGTQAVVMADISNGTVVGAGSIVTKTYPVNAVIAGNPARILRYRDQSKEADEPL